MPLWQGRTGPRVKAENEAGLGDYEGQTLAWMSLGVFVCSRVQQVSVWAGGSKKNRLMAAESSVLAFLPLITFNICLYCKAQRADGA